MRGVITIDNTGANLRVKLSPDNKRLAYNYDRALWTVSALGGAPIKLLDRFASGFTWSPDSRWIAFAEGGKLFKISSQGGAEPILVAESEDRTFDGTAWIGDSIYAPAGADVMRVSAAGGKPVKVASPRPVAISGYSADGRTLYVFENVEGSRPRVLPIDIASGAIGKAIDLDTDGAVDSVSVHSSGKRFAALVRLSTYNLYTLEGFAK